jgi:tetratricopeptide (TPR) repeat protein
MKIDMRKIHLIPKKKIGADSQKANPEHQEGSVPYQDITQDPDFQLLLAESQRGHWNEYRQLISSLDKKYPGNEKLSGLQRDFELKFTVINDFESNVKEEKRKRLITNLKIWAIIIGSMIVIGLIINSEINKSQKENQNKQQQAIAEQVNALRGQVEILLNSGQPEKTVELIQRIQAIDPSNPIIGQLTQKREAILKIDGLYKDAVDKLSKGNYADALIILTNIDKQNPEYKDVTQLIKETNNKIKIQQVLSDGTKAYNESNWPEAIKDFEMVLALDPNNSSPNLMEMLTSSYLNPAFQMVKDPAQTVDSLNQAYTYLGKAAILNPQDASIQTEVKKMGLYRNGFDYYIGMNWQAAIQQLTSLINLDENYADGFAREILYEAHFSLGNQFYAIGDYPDAQNEFQLAETLASGGSNLVKIYLADIYLARTLGKLTAYDQADAVFINGLQAITFQNRTVTTVFVNNLRTAFLLYGEGRYEDAYNLFTKLLVGNNEFYEMKIIQAYQGNCLALIALEYKTSVQAILQQNNLSKQTVVASEQTLNIPWLP